MEKKAKQGSPSRINAAERRGGMCFFIGPQKRSGDTTKKEKKEKVRQYFHITLRSGKKEGSRAGLVGFIKWKTSHLTKVDQSGENEAK